MYKFIGWMDNRGHYDVEIKGWMQKVGGGGIMMCKCCTSYVYQTLVMFACFTG